MNIRELRADDLAPLLGLYTHLHEHDDPLPSAPEVQAVWAEALANPRIQYFGGWDGPIDLVLHAHHHPESDARMPTFRRH